MSSGRPRLRLRPRSFRPAPRAVLTVALAAFLALTACPSREPRIVVGSKNFSEQVLLGEIVAQAIERRTGLPVDRRLNLGGTFVCDHAIRAGEIDVYVEYTGTAWTAILKEPPRGDARAVLDAVRERYAGDGLVWTEPFGFDNTFALVVRGGDAQRLGLETISDAAPHAREWRAAFGYEFMERADGYPGLARTYALAFREPPRTMDLGLLYRALVGREVDLVVGNSTDGLIESLGLHVLEDDRGYFPPYEAAPVVRRATLERHPALGDAIAALGGTIPTAVMRRLNFEVDGEKTPVRDVARRFLDGLAGTARRASPGAGR